MRALVQEHDGRVENSAGDSLLVEFPSVIKAVQCAIEMQHELKARNAELPPSHRVEFRMGLDLGEVLTGGGQIHGEGINIAVRVEGLAQAGGICISEAVYDQIRDKLTLEYKDLGKRKLKNIERRVRVYQIQMEPTPIQPDSRTSRTWQFCRSFLPSRHWLIGGTILGVLVFALLSLLRDLPIPKPIPPSGQGREPALPNPPEALGVMRFEISRADPQSEWMGEAIRNNLNSQLSRASDLRVYAKEHIDFLVRKDSSTEIEVANRLGITKMIAGSFLALGEILRIEAHIIDVKSGLIEISEVVEGKLTEFVRLDRQLALKIMAHLNVVVSPRELPAASPSSLESFRNFFEAEGETPAISLSTEEDTPSLGSPQKEKDRGSYLAPMWKWLGASEAWADEVPPDELTPEEEIKQVLERYRQAHEQKSLDLLENVYGSMTPAQIEANIRYFQNTRRLKVTISEVDVDIRGDEAVASYTREDEFIDANTGQNVTIDVRLTKTFVRTDDTWKMVSRRR